MATFCLHFLLLAVSPNIIMVLSEDTVSEDTWMPPYTPHPPPPPMPSSPSMEGPGRLFYTAGDNMTAPAAGDLEAYCQMLLEAAVPIPQDQIPWFCLCTQCQSTQGPKGDQGDRGLPGRPGSPGIRGLTGFRGPPGFQGRQGIKGQKGDDGEKGDRGMQGFTGPKGARGFKGDKGDQGPEGRNGDPGPKGDDGICPDSCEASQGPPGPSGLPGPAGPRGLAGTPGPTGPKGMKGDMGDMGIPGTPGSKGGKGDLGPKGDCNCTDGENGAPGMKGGKGDKGDQGQMGVAGQDGPQGDKGDMGLMGMMGPPGPCMPSIQSAFSAGLNTSFPPPNAPVVFANVIYNIQEGYDPAEGVYTAPVNGTYVLSYHLTVHERVLKVGLFHNHVAIIITTDPKVLGTTSQSVVLHLARGDRVWLQVKNDITNGMYAGPESSSTFSGFLLHPDTCDMPFFRTHESQASIPEGEYTWPASPETTAATTTSGGSK